MWLRSGEISQNVPKHVVTRRESSPPQCGTYFVFTKILTSSLFHGFCAFQERNPIFHAHDEKTQFGDQTSLAALIFTLKSCLMSLGVRWEWSRVVGKSRWPMFERGPSKTNGVKRIPLSWHLMAVLWNVF